MGQQPNIDLDMEHLPRPTDHPGVPRRWSPGRVGELTAPEEVPAGGTFGATGPDAGYALTLLADREISTAPGERRRDAVAAVAAVMSARAAAFGRAPMIGDADVAEVILGYAGIGPDVSAARSAAVVGMAHHAAASRPLMAAVDRKALVASLDEVRRRAESGEPLIAL